MSIETDLIAYLVSQNLACSSRVYPLELPQEAVLPAMTYFQVTTPVVQQSHDRQLMYELELYQFDCYGTLYREAKELARAVKSALLGWTAHETHFEDMKDLSEFELERFRITVEFSIGGAPVE